jgi:hypothetical protein
VLESGLQKSREEITALKKIIEVSSREHQDGEFDAVEEQILACFHHASHDLTMEYFANMFDFGIIRHRFDILLEKNLIEQATGAESPEYSITPKGVAHVIKGIP